ncbi:hypothetical protein F4778DRAFT_764659 [Xylariomycetidae sp. FL2044]|nr:hypothetical protein F4778DRAFT_764659 [Xylariomycetidae sp. FL2044]
MTEGVQASEDAAAARASEQARLRKERREAKLKAGGAARLNKIIGNSGGVPRDPVPTPPSESTTPLQPAAATAATQQPEQHHDDPEEVDISQHHYSPRMTPRPLPSPNSNSISEAQLRQMMLGFEGSPALSRNPQFATGGSMGMENDPMKLLSQMMGNSSGSGMGGGANPFAGTPMEGLFNSMGAGGNPMQAQRQQAAAAATQKTENLWRILHALLAVGLGLYFALSTTFTGTRAEREDGSISISSPTTVDSASGKGNDVNNNNIDQTRAYFFYVFTSAEALLLTTRFLLHRDRAPPAGMAWTVSGFLPGPFKGYLQHALRYGQLFSTVRMDVLVCVFVMGVCAWVRS